MEIQHFYKGDEPRHQTPEFIQQLKNTDNNISRAVDLWVENILGGFITEFIVDSMVSYSKAK